MSARLRIVAGGVVMPTVRAADATAVRPGLLGIGSPRVPSDLTPEPPQGLGDPHSDWRPLTDHELRLAAKPIAALAAWIEQQGELTWGNRVIFTADVARALGTLHIFIRVGWDGSVERKRRTP